MTKNIAKEHIDVFPFELLSSYIGIRVFCNKFFFIFLQEKFLGFLGNKLLEIICIYKVMMNYYLYKSTRNE